VCSIWNRFTKPFHLSDLEGHKKYGSIIGIYEGLRPVLQITEPTLIKKVLIEEFWNFCNHRVFYHESQVAGKNLVVLENHKWKRMRQILSPVFSSAKLKSMKEGYDDCIETLISNLTDLTNNPSKSAILDVKDYFGSFTVDIMCSVCFGIKINSLRDPKNEVVHNIKTVFGESISLKAVIVLFFPSLMKLFDLYLLNYDCLVFLNQLTRSILSERKSEASNLKKKDFIRLLMEAKSEDGESLSESEIADQVILFFVAGYDTSSSALCHIAYCLALNPHVQEKLHEELRQFQERDDNYLERMNSLKYLDAVVKESLRFLPTVPRMERRSSRDCRLGDLFIPKDTVVIIPIYTLGQDKRYFPDPEKFNPDRFLAKTSTVDEQVMNQIFLPFAAGPRSCIGQRFALMEIKACLIHIIPKFKFELCPETSIPLVYSCGHPVSTAKDVTLRITRR
jgi:cytochrome P450 family 3 subfamily A